MTRIVSITAPLLGGSPFERLLAGRSPQLGAAVRMAQVVAATDATVLLTGETGTGKELMAQAIHQASRRADRPFLALNCAALPDNLVESELFGCRRGAFTGAVADQPGKLMAADGGTVFLDEIGELPLPAQAKLLRFLETGEIQPVGQAAPRRVNVRVVAATNRALAEQAAAGQFRHDLFYRLNVVPIEVPPLRRREGDVALLLEVFLDRFSELHGSQPLRLDDEAWRAVQRYSWPGNVRELRNVCERMAILHAGRQVGLADLPEEMRGDGAAVLPVVLPDGGIVLEDLERSLIGEALRKARGNRSEAARLLGMTRDTLLYRIKKYAMA